MRKDAPRRPGDPMLSNSNPSAGSLPKANSNASLKDSGRSSTLDLACASVSSLANQSFPILGLAQCRILLYRTTPRHVGISGDYHDASAPLQVRSGSGPARHISSVPYYAYEERPQGLCRTTKLIMLSFFPFLSLLVDKLIGFHIYLHKLLQLHLSVFPICSTNNIQSSCQVIAHLAYFVSTNKIQGQ